MFTIQSLSLSGLGRAGRACALSRLLYLRTSDFPQNNESHNALPAPHGHSHSAALPSLSCRRLHSLARLVSRSVSFSLALSIVLLSLLFSFLPSLSLQSSTPTLSPLSPLPSLLSFIKLAELIQCWSLFSFSSPLSLSPIDRILLPINIWDSCSIAVSQFIALSVSVFLSADDALL